MSFGISLLHVVAVVPVTLDTAFAIRALNLRAMVWISSDNAQRGFDRRLDDDDDGCLRMDISTDPLRRHMRLLLGLCTKKDLSISYRLCLSLLCHFMCMYLIILDWIHAHVLFLSCSSIQY